MPAFLRNRSLCNMDTCNIAVRETRAFLFLAFPFDCAKWGIKRKEDETWPVLQAAVRGKGTDLRNRLVKVFKFSMLKELFFVCQFGATKEIQQLNLSFGCLHLHTIERNLWEDLAAQKSSLWKVEINPLLGHLHGGWSKPFVKEKKLKGQGICVMKEYLN